MISLERIVWLLVDREDEPIDKEDAQFLEGLARTVRREQLWQRLETLGGAQFEIKDWEK